MHLSWRNSRIKSIDVAAPAYLDLHHVTHKSDAMKIAELYRISSDGLAEYIWTALAGNNEAILDVGTRRYARENTQYSYQNCIIAELNQQVVGMLAAYPFAHPKKSRRRRTRYLHRILNWKKAIAYIFPA
jgi:hypothetical protein